jgi:photosystem II stability/assembly factor-like uncharacterized protein
VTRRRPTVGGGGLAEKRRTVTRRLLASLTLASSFFGLSVVRAGTLPLPAVDPPSYAALHWRSLGPFRGGRAVAVAGVAGDPRTFYFGAVDGGVWKTENAGRTWSPIADALPVASFGALAVAPSDARTVYAGSGEADMRSDIAHGNGLYRSNDAGATWTFAGLADSRQIGRILVDPHDANTLLVAALGHAYGPNDVRGVYRSRDGGVSWARTLFRDADTGAIDLAADPALHTVFASLWQTRRPPWSVYPPSNGPGSGLYRSRDGGVTWSALTGNGFPSEKLGKIGIAVAPSNPARIYAIVDAAAGGLYRSDDGGDSWRAIDTERRIWQRGWYFDHVTVDPRDPDVVYISNTSLYRSTDGGAHFTAIKGSPDGDDFHQLWIDPSDASRMVLGSDQGTSVSLDGGATWSSWFNQPTGQFYHVAVDNGFPYRLYGAQQDSGAAAILSRSDHSGIEERDWRAITAGGESGTIVADPRDSNVIFGGEVDREDLRTNQTRALSPVAGRPGVWRAEWTQPLAFGPDGALYAAFQSIFRTRDGGDSWTAVSGDLTRPHPGVPATLDAPTAQDNDGAEPRGVVYALAPSPLDAKTVWAGTDDGLVKLTTDNARTWRDVTPPQTVPWSHIDAIEASHFDVRTAYVAIDRHRLDDDRPDIAVTHDGGRSWRHIAAGIPDGSYVDVVREDPLRRGLLYAGTESGVFVSFDDGGAWQSLRLNMPLVSVRDIAVHDGDLAIATHGRAFWVLDDVEPLRELAHGIGSGAHLFAPRDAVRLRAGNDEAEASPPETPLGENPPAGAFLDYVLPPDTKGDVRLEIAAGGRVLRRFSSADPLTPPDAASVDFPAYWLQAPVPLSAAAGMHRFVWDFHIARADGPLAPPGRYAVRLIADGRTLAATLVVRRDPRVHASDADLVAAARLAEAIDALQTRVRATLARPQTKPTLREDERLLGDLRAAVESADAAPTADERTAWLGLEARVRVALAAEGPPSKSP